MKATKYTTAMSDPHSFVEFPDSGSHAFPAIQESIICCHASPVAHLSYGLHNEKISVFITWNTLYPVTYSHVIIIFYDNTLHKDLRMWKAAFLCRENIHCAFVNVHKLLNSEFAFVFISKYALLGVFDFNNSEMWSSSHSNNAASCKFVIKA